MPGAAGATLMFAVGLASPFTLTITCTESPGNVSYGTCALIWVALTKTSGAGFPPIVTEVPAREAGNGVDAADCEATARSVPKMLNKDPGATVGEKLAALTTPPDEICGGAVTCNVICAI